MEGVARCVGGLARVAVGSRLDFAGGAEGVGASGGAGADRVEVGVEFGGRGGGSAEEGDLAGGEGGEGQGGVFEGGPEEAWFGGDEELLIGGRDVEVGADEGGEVGDCGGCGEGERDGLFVVGQDYVEDFF